ncbi:MAG: VOC family protein [Thermoguttaceae bacterium]
MRLPDGYQQVMPYLIVKGAAEFLNFAKNVFGAEERMKVMRDEKTVMHAEMTIGASVIMFADATSQFEPRPAALFVYVEDADQTYERAIAAGATSLRPVSDQEYGRSGGVLDPFGNAWWPTTPPNPSYLLPTGRLGNDPQADGQQRATTCLRRRGAPTRAGNDLRSGGGGDRRARAGPAVVPSMGSVSDVSHVTRGNGTSA